MTELKILGHVGVGDDRKFYFEVKLQDSTGITIGKPFGPFGPFEEKTLAENELDKFKDIVLGIISEQGDVLVVDNNTGAVYDIPQKERKDDGT